MSLGRLALQALAVAALVAFVAMLSVDVILPWDHYVNVPDASRSELSQLSSDELQDRLLKGTIALKAVKGVEKVYYILSLEPSYFAYRWMYFLVPSVAAAFIGGLLANRARVA